MKIRGIKHNNRKKAFQVRLHNRNLQYPYVKADPQPTSANKIVEVIIDKEMASEGFLYAIRAEALLKLIWHHLLMPAGDC